MDILLTMSHDRIAADRETRFSSGWLDLDAREDLRMTCSEIPSASGSIAEAGNDDLALLLAEVSNSLVDAVGVDYSATARVDPEDDTADVVVLACLPQAPHNRPSVEVALRAQRQKAYFSGGPCHCLCRAYTHTFTDSSHEIDDAHVHDRLLAACHRPIHHPVVMVESLKRLRIGLWIPSMHSR